MRLNRLSGLVVALLGIFMLVYIIPQHTETVDYGWLRPATLPIVSTIIVIIASIVHLIFPAGTAEFDIGQALRAGLFFMISLTDLFLLHYFGFLIAAPLLIMALMLLVGERRLTWLFAGIVLIPLAMWSSVRRGCRTTRRRTSRHGPGNGHGNCDPLYVYA